MKLAAVLVSLSLAVLVAMIFQTVRQEMKLRSAKTRMVENSAEVKRKEEAIVEVKAKIDVLKKSLGAANSKVENMKKMKEETAKSTEGFVQSLADCNKQKEEAAKKKTDIVESITKLKADHEVAKQKAEVEIQGLKQQILDRDKAICAFADTTKEEARKLCGISQ